MNRIILALATGLAIVSARPALADPSPFDLAGPTLRVTVTRAGKTLPIGEVPQLAAGDRLSIEAKLPANQTAHYLMVVAFLRDPTNPPPDAWFQKSETWRHSGRGGGPIDLTIPAGAQHLVLFLAPATGGDFRTLRQAVEARPGAFVRAAQDLEQASLDRSRYEAYLNAIRKVAADAPESLAAVAPVVASSLHIKINEDCLQRQPELQAVCLLDARQSVVLGNGDNAGSSSLSAAATDLALSLSATPAGGLGYYSGYISAIREIVGIFSAMHTARYQYIPALDVTRGDAVALVLNTPPSFANPKSVLMAALPEVTASHPPAMAILSGAPVLCLGAKNSFLPIAVGPLFYATGYAHDLTLHVTVPDKAAIELPLVADTARGGLQIGLPAAMPTGLAGTLSAQIVGMWGFEPFTGPAVTLQTAADWRWQAQPVGKDARSENGQLMLTGAPAACVSAVTMTMAHGTPQPAAWKVTGLQEMAITLPAATEKGEQVKLDIAGPEGTVPARLSVAAPTKAPPPSAQVVAHSSELVRADQSVPITITLDNPNEIPADARLSFTLKASGTQVFTGHEIVEVGTADGDPMVKLTLGNGLVRVDAGMMVASLIPAQGLGMSAFGPLRTRLVRDGMAGEWLTFGSLVRLPRLKQINCPTRLAVPCTLTGDGLYLLASVSTTRDFDNATSVPEGYPGFTLRVPHPLTSTGLYVRLHDAPEVINHIGQIDSSAEAK